MTKKKTKVIFLSSLKKYYFEFYRQMNSKIRCGVITVMTKYENFINMNKEEIREFTEANLKVKQVQHVYRKFSYI